MGYFDGFDSTPTRGSSGDPDAGSDAPDVGGGGGGSVGGDGVPDGAGDSNPNTGVDDPDFPSGGGGGGGGSPDFGGGGGGGGGGNPTQPDVDPVPVDDITEPVANAVDAVADPVTDTVSEVADPVTDRVDDLQDSFTVDDAGDFGDDTIGRGDGPSTDDDLPDPDEIDVPDNQDDGQVPLSYRTPGLVDDLNQQVRGLDLAPEDVDVSIDRGGNDDTVTVTAELSDTARAPNLNFNDSVSFDSSTQRSGRRTINTAPDPTTADTVPAVQPSTDRIADRRQTSIFGGGDAEGVSIGGTTIAARGEDFPTSVEEVPRALSGGQELVDTDLPTTLGGQRDAVSDSIQQAIPGVDPGNVNDAPLRSGLQTFRENAGNAINDARNSDGAAGGVAGAAAFGVAAPEPVSTGVGAATLGGIALGGAITGVANELGNPEDRSDLPGEGAGELGQPTESPTVTREIDVPDRSPGSANGEIGVPDRTPSTTTGEIDVPDRTPATQIGEIDVPSIEAQQFAGQQSPIFEEERERINEPEITEDDLPADPFGTPQERGGTPDRFIREDRNPFVFPGGSPVGTGTEPATDTTPDTAIGSGAGFGSVGRPGVDTIPGLGVGIGSRPGVDTDLGAGLRGRTDTVARADTAADTAQQTTNDVANQTATQTTTQNLNQTTTTTTTARSPNRRRIRRPRIPELPGGDDQIVGGLLPGQRDPFTDERENPIIGSVADITGRNRREGRRSGGEDPRGETVETGFRGIDAGVFGDFGGVGL